ncbi:MAG TPA: hypothetical protein VI997_07055 [Candidatus Thermoplasmatota archaeon]|nr:hypothetical protein [Candidatus Thermoplasmatota archaeon]
MRALPLLVLAAVFASFVALAEPAAAKPVCVAGSDCGYGGNGLVCTRWDPARHYWTDCAVDWGACGILYHRCVPPP